MRVSSLFALAVSAGAVVGCTNSPSRLDGAANAVPAAAKPTEPGAAHAGSTPAVAGSDAERIAQLERRLNKVTTVLDKALGPAEPDPTATYSVPIGELDPVEGPRDAKVTIVEAYEFLCPFCYQVNPIVDQIRAKYPNDVRVVSKYMVIHGAPAATAGQYACAAAKQGKFVEMKNALWEKLWTTEGGRPKARPEEMANIDALAGSLGLDRGKLTADLESCKPWLASAQQLARVGVRGTPAFFVNGRPVNDLSPATFDKLVAEELAKAKQSNLSASEYYRSEVVAKGLTQVQSRFD